MLERSSLLDGQTALVTGASAGLGRRFAFVLAAAGAKVAAAARRLDRLEALVAEIRAAGGTAEAIPVDVTDASSIPAAVDEAERRLGPVSILVNNAGMTGVGLAVEQDLGEIDDLLAANLRAPFLVAREVARRLIDAGLPGRIVNISSIGAFRYTGEIDATFYALTKSGIERMSEVLAVEWARHNINVNTIAPGFFRTEMTEAVIEQMGEALLAGTPRGRFGEPSRLDSSLLYLVAPNSEFVTGTCVKADDGQNAR